MTLKNFNVFIGSTTGCLKGALIGTNAATIKSEFQNITTNKVDISNKYEITCMEWANESSEQMILGYKSKVKLYDTLLAEFINETPFIDGTIRGAFKENEFVFAALDSGIVKLYDLSNENGGWSEHLKLNGSVERIRRNSMKNYIIASGGRDNDLKLWDLSKKSVIFAAKNVKPDELQLQVPVWISDIAFARQNENVAICSRYGHVRLYDPLLPQRRPVFNAHQEEQVFTCLNNTPNEHQMLVGGGSGDIFLVDTRNGSSFVGKYKGCCGAVKSISCPDDNNLVFSASLDRYFRIHDFQTRKLLRKDYMHSRLTTVLSKTPFVLKKFEIKEELSDDEGSEEIPNKKRKTKRRTKLLDEAFYNLESIEEDRSDIN